MRRVAAVLVAAGVALAAARGTTGTSDASWTDRERTGGGMGSALADCTTPAIYASSAGARFLTGTAAGRSLDGLAALPGVQVDAAGARVVATPASAVPLGGDAYRTGIDASALRSVTVGTGNAALPILFADLGAYEQVGAAHATGSAAAGAGAVGDSGAVDSGGIAAGTEPSVGTVDVDRALAAVGADLPSGLSGTRLHLGAVAAHAALDGCAALWGRAAAPVRDYRVTSAVLGTTSAAVQAFGGTASAQAGTVMDAVTAVADSGSGPGAAARAVAAALSTGLQAAVGDAASGGVVAGAVLSTATPTVSITVPSADRAAVATALAARTADPSAAVTVTPSSGRVSLDLGALTGVDGRDPNTSVLSPAVATDAAGRLGAAVTTHRTALDSALAALVGDVVVTGSATTSVGTGVGRLYQPRFQVTASVSGTAVQLASGSAPSPVVTVTPSAGTAFSSALASAISADLVPAVATAVRQQVADPLQATRTAAGTAVAAAASTAATAASTELTALPAAVGLTVDVQPDRPPYPPAASGAAAGARSVTAVRLAIPARSDGLVVDLATASVGPIAPLNRSP